MRPQASEPVRVDLGEDRMLPGFLENQSRVYTFSDSPELVENVESQDGFILAVSEAPPAVSCFFYMH